jgi:ribosomal protein S18 acetylase RimI-like enzyme
MIRYRIFNKSDCLEVSRLYKTLIQHISDETEDPYFKYEPLADDFLLSSLESGVGDPSKVVFVATSKNEIIGFIAGEEQQCFLPISNTKIIGYVSGAFVKPKFRHQGIMKQLELLLEEHFRNKGIQFLELNVLNANTLGKGSWEKLGFKTFREQMRKEIL